MEKSEEVEQIKSLINSQEFVKFVKRFVPKANEGNITQAIKEIVFNNKIKFK